MYFYTFRVYVIVRNQNSRYLKTKMFLDGCQFNNKNAHMAQKEIILYGKITFYVIFLPWENLHSFKKENIIVHEIHFFLFESQQSILLQK